MAAVHPEPKPAREHGAARAKGENSPVREGPRPATAEVVGSTPVNNPAAGPSNAKETRVREAEEDRALIAKARTGDTTAYGSLVERHQRRAFAVVYSYVHDENDACEIVQESFLRVFKGLGTFQGGASFFTWLYKILTNLSIDHLRRSGRTLGAGLSGVPSVAATDDGDHDQEPSGADIPLLARIDGADPAAVLRRREIGARLQAALDALPPYHRGVILMREVEGLSYDEMAEVMGVSKGTIMSRLFHARQKLQRALYDCYLEQVGVPPGVNPPDGDGT